MVGSQKEVIKPDDKRAIALATKTPSHGQTQTLKPNCVFLLLLNSSFCCFRQKQSPSNSRQHQLLPHYNLTHLRTFHTDCDCNFENLQVSAHHFPVCKWAIQQNLWCGCYRHSSVLILWGSRLVERTQLGHHQQYKDSIECQQFLQQGRMLSYSWSGPGGLKVMSCMN